MPKGYLIAHVTVTDPEAFAAYAKAAGPLMKTFGGTAIARGGRYENLEGEANERHLVFEFPSYEDAKRFYDCPEYQTAKALREGAATGTFVIVEGVE